MTAIDLARAGDERAFRELVEPHRHELLVHCYRLLGSFTDAEDVLQETLLAAWRGLDGYEGRAALRTWLYRIATHRCINARRDAGRRPAEPVAPFAPPEPTRRSEVTWLQPWPDAGPEAHHESVAAVELAFVAGLAHLPPRQAAALVLRDVLDFSTAEVAGLLDTTPTVVKGLVQRARSAVGQRPQRPAAAAERELAGRFAAAYVAGDVDGVVALLTDDVWLAMPPAPHEYLGRAAVTAFLAGVVRGWRPAGGPRADHGGGRLPGLRCPRRGRACGDHRADLRRRRDLGHHAVPHPRAVPPVRPQFRVLIADSDCQSSHDSAQS